MVAMLPQVDRLPRSEQQLAVRDRDRKTHRGQRALDVGRHVVQSLGRVRVERIALGHEAREPALEITSDRGVCVLLNQEARGGVADEECRESFAESRQSDDFRHFVRDVIEALATYRYCQAVNHGRSGTARHAPVMQDNTPNSTTAVGSSEPRRQRIAAACVVGMLLLGAAIAYLEGAIAGVSPAAFLASLLLARRLERNGLVLALALVATLITLTAHLWAEGVSVAALLDAPTLVWCGLYWMAAASLTWDPGRDVGLRELTEAFSHAPTALVLLDRMGNVIDVNDAFAELCHVARADILGINLMDLIGGPLWEDLSVERQQLARGQREYIQFEREFSLHDGARVWASIYSRLVRDRKGRPTYIVVQAVDLTEQRRAQRALAESESRFRGIIENAGEIVLVIDAEGRIGYANSKAYAVLGAQPGSLVGAAPLPFISAADRNEFGRALARTYRRPRETFRVSRVRLEGETDTYLDVQLTGLPDAPGIGGTVVTGRVSTEEVRTEQQLRSSESKFSTVFHSSPDAILILRNSDSIVLDFNTGFTRLLGYTREEAIGVSERLLNIWNNSADRDRVQEELEKNHECLDFETELVAKNGEILHTEISVRFVELDGELCVLCIGRDITERRQAEQALQESEDKFARIFAGSPDGIVIIRLEDGCIVDINEAFLTASGYARDELVGHRVGQLPIFSDRTQLRSATQRVLAAGSYQNFEFNFVTKSGEEIPALVSATVVELEGKKSLVCIAKDNRVQRETEAKLRGSEAKFRGAFENAPIGMLLVDLQGRIQQANHFALDTLAYPETELVGAHISRLVPAEDRPALRDTFQRLVQRSGNVTRSERRLVSQTGVEIWTTFHIVLQRAETGAPLYFIIQLADITDLKHSQARMERMAFYDTLTDLANRRLFGNRLEQSIQHSLRAGTRAALLYLDLDQFKRVNDTLGHEAGDELLREVARRLTECVRKEDTVARPGGDEFAILLYEIGAPSDAGSVAEKILEQLRRPVTISGHQLVVTTSIGITIIPDDSEEANILTKNADLAMYRAKERGRNNYQYFSEEMNTLAQKRLKTENELRMALEQEQFELFYQPKVDIRDNRIVGVEALIRWHHPERGLLTPDQFIGVAEETGAIVGIGSWVIRQACLAARDLSAKTGEALQAGVNISPRQFRDPNLIRTIRRCIREAEIQPGQLELEITETMLMEDAEAALFTIERLRELGVRIAIDDFGTGYSSLNYLKRFPIDTVKIDRSFVMEIPTSHDDMAITTAVIAMAHRLELEVVAEGIETLEQLAFLAEQQCEYGQGYLFSRPVPISEVAKLLDSNVSLLRAPRRKPAS
jgi:diguanylate cyclase (GGDEF)-like protein/PAS domain S-box-containing protein